MSLLSFDNLNASVELYVKNKNGRYKPASTEEILATARKEIATLFDKKPFSNPAQVKAFFSHKLAGLSYEVGAFMFLDNQLGLIDYMEMFHGTVNQASVYPREVAKAALKLNATSVIMAHNHPSGANTPSDSDIQLTHHLVRALELVDVRLIDHIIVAGSGTISLAERGEL